MLLKLILMAKIMQKLQQAIMIMLLAESKSYLLLSVYQAKLTLKKWYKTALQYSVKIQCWFALFESSLVQKIDVEQCLKYWWLDGLYAKL
jgi:hypothetical protein